MAGEATVVPFVVVLVELGWELARAGSSVKCWSVGWTVGGIGYREKQPVRLTAGVEVCAAAVVERGRMFGGEVTTDWGCQ